VPPITVVLLVLVMMFSLTTHEVRSHVPTVELFFLTALSIKVQNGELLLLMSKMPDSV
jgi:hypothetical protein